MLVLGLTGGIATGKSTVSNILCEEYKIPVIDADKIAREVVEPGEKCFDQIVQHFKDLVPDLLVVEKGKIVGLNRANLGAYVFTHKDGLEKLNSYTHPAIKRRILYRILQAYFSGEIMVVLDVPLLFETGMDWLCSRILCVVCDENTQLQRLLARNKELDIQQAKSRISAQMPLKSKVKLSDYCIHNDGNLQDLRESLESLLNTSFPALKINKPNHYLVWVFGVTWNFLQLIFPPFAIAGCLAALTRRLINKSMKS